ncbi:MAG: hypothetical protein GEU80_08970 [Dehalococcoidia bacterium]|nr:hypothetical protein [Dehalococcoidia bacterium]
MRGTEDKGGWGMATREEVIEAIRGIDGRLEAIREAILANGEQPLDEGTWRVRDALSHLAARSNGVQRVLGMAEAARTGSGAVRPPGSIDEINAGQVEERRNQSVEELLEEIRAGHAAAAEAVAGLDDDTLAQVITIPRPPGELSVSDMLLRGGPGHDAVHLAQVEAVVTPR